MTTLRNDRGLSTRPEERGDFDKMAIECITEARWKPGENDAKGKQKQRPREIRETTSAKDEFLEKISTTHPEMLMVFAFVLLLFFFLFADCVCFLLVNFMAVFSGAA